MVSHRLCKIFVVQGVRDGEKTEYFNTLIINVISLYNKMECFCIFTS